MTPTATYHGITYAKCHACGYESTDVTSLELWNDYGVQCPKAEGDAHSPEALTEWRTLTGTAFTNEAGVLPMQKFGHDDDDWKCHCGNTAVMSGFGPCSADGLDMEPAAGWDGHYKCGACGAVAKIEETK